MPGPDRRGRRQRGRTARRVGFVSTYAFPAGVTRSYRRACPDLSDAQLDHLVAAVRQWCRLLARAPRARLAVPSAAVEDFWVALLERPRDYAELCNGAFGRVPRPVSPVPVPRAGAATRSAALHRTHVLACADEELPPTGMPLLFRVDWLVDRVDGRAYAPNCGQVRYCVAPEGTTCLAHLVRAPRGTLGLWRGPAAGGTAFDGTSGVAAAGRMWR